MIAGEVDETYYYYLMMLYWLYWSCVAWIDYVLSSLAATYHHLDFYYVPDDVDNYYYYYVNVTCPIIVSIVHLQMLASVTYDDEHCCYEYEPCFRC